MLGKLHPDLVPMRKFLTYFFRHRAPRSSRGRSDADEAAYGILDGDLLEQMLTHMETAPELVEAIYDPDEFLYPLTELKKDLEVLHTMH